jgi:hypothetical protein
MSSSKDIPERSGASTDNGVPAEPPRAPSIARRLALTRKQVIGLPLLGAIPILTLFGVFGEQRSSLHAASGSVEMSVRYPTRFRYRQIQSLDITVRNTSDETIDTIGVSLDTAYISRFSSVRIDPAPRSAFVVALTGVRPGESRLISAELWGERYGRHEGHIAAIARSDTAVATVRTIVFP